MVCNVHFEKRYRARLKPATAGGCVHICTGSSPSPAASLQPSSPDSPAHPPGRPEVSTSKSAELTPITSSDTQPSCFHSRSPDVSSARTGIEPAVETDLQAPYPPTSTQSYATLPSGLRGVIGWSIICREQPGARLWPWRCICTPPGGILAGCILPYCGERIGPRRPPLGSNHRDDGCVYCAYCVLISALTSVLLEVEAL